MVIGKHSGKRAVQHKLADLGYAVSEKDAVSVTESIKALARVKKRLTHEDLLRTYLKIKTKKQQPAPKK